MRWSFVFLAACGGGAADLTIAPGWDGARLPVSRTVLGHNTVWSRDGLGLWNGDDVDPAAWPSVTALAPGALRFPGGTRALRWHWDETIGDARTPQCDVFTGARDPTGYGFDEMLEVAARLDAPVSLVVPLADGTPDLAAGMLAHAAGSDVRLVEIGNEPYLDLGVGPSTSCDGAPRFRQDTRWDGAQWIPITAADYAAQVRAYATALRAVDPEVVVGAAALSDGDVATARGPNDASDAWNPTVAAGAGDAIGAWVVHAYDLSLLDDRVTLAERTRAAARDLQAIAPHPVAVTEFGTLFDGSSMLNALVTADFVRVAVEEQWMLLDRHILIEDDPSEPFANSAAILGADHAHTPGWEVEHALAGALRGEAAAVDAPGDDLATLATIDDGGIGLVVIDRRLTGASRAVSMALPPGAWSGTATTITAPALTSTDVTVSDAPAAGQADLTLDLPPISVTVVRLALE